MSNKVMKVLVTEIRTDKRFSYWRLDKGTLLDQVEDKTYVANEAKNYVLTLSNNSVVTQYDIDAENNLIVITEMHSTKEKIVFIANENGNEYIRSTERNVRNWTDCEEDIEYLFNIDDLHDCMQVDIDEEDLRLLEQANDELFSKKIDL